ncbi:MAG: hypothetical protein ACLTVG_21450 [Coprococcus sp.]
MKERIKGAFTKRKILHVLKMALFVVALSLILLSLLGTVAHATGLVDDTINAVLWSSIFVTLMANKIGGLQFGIYRNCQISSRVFHTAVAALPLTKANRSDFE